MASETFEFMSPSWVSEVRTIIENLLAGMDLTDVNFSISEEMTDPPQDRFGFPPQRVGWHMRLYEGIIDVGASPLDVADIRVVADYRTHHDLSRRVWAGDPVEMAISKSLREQAMLKGKLRTEGDLSAAPPLIRDLVLALHDRVANMTR